MESLFVHPAFVATGGALVASPIIIHIINRLRFRRVRFAAMEFLLQSQKKNRRRILIEQLLLLLLRILIVIAITLLIARLILSPTQLAQLQGDASAHHVILIDDSGSMREVAGPKSAFQRAKEAAIQLVKVRGVDEAGEQRVSILFLSKLHENKLDQALLNKEANEQFLKEMLAALDKVDCTYRELDLNEGLKGAADYLTKSTADQGATTIKYIHVLSDFRNADWKTSDAMVSTVKSLTDPPGSEAEKARNRVYVSFIRSAKKEQPNLAITKMEASVETAAVGIPIALTVTVKNFGTESVEDIYLTTYLDGKRLLRRAPIDKIEAGEEESKTVYIPFNTKGPHQIQMKLVRKDALEGDNSRFLAIDYLPPINKVLLIDGDPEFRDGLYVADVMTSDPTQSGIAVDKHTPDWLIGNSLVPYQCVFLVNVPQLDAEAIARLEKYVQAGGGLCWFVGERIQPRRYNEDLYKIRVTGKTSDGKPKFVVTGLFPVPLGPLSMESPLPESQEVQRDLRLDASHPIFDDLVTGRFDVASRVKRIWPVGKKIPGDKLKADPSERGSETDVDWDPRDSERGDGVRTIATLERSNPQPLVFEHRLGKGTIVTCLTSAGRTWTDWPQKGTHYPVLIMQIRDRIVQKVYERQRVVGEAIEEIVSKKDYKKSGRIGAPEFGADTYKLDADEAAKQSDSSKSSSTDKENPKQVFRFASTELPGVYSLHLARTRPSERTGSTEDSFMFAYNVSTHESETKLEPTDQIKKEFADNKYFRIFDFDQKSGFTGEEAGNDMRLPLLFLLILLFVGEQLLAYRLGYHTRNA